MKNILLLKCFLNLLKKFLKKYSGWNIGIVFFKGYYLLI